MADGMIFRWVSSLVKAFLDDDPADFSEIETLTALKGERISWQLLYKGAPEGKRRQPVTFRLALDRRIGLRCYQVENVPCLLPCRVDPPADNYLRTDGGLFPDLLQPLTEMRFDTVAKNCHSLFFTAFLPETLPAGEYPICLSLTAGEVTLEKTITLRVLAGALPPQETVYTQWFYADCIASYYGLEVFSQAHWAMVEKFIAMAAHTGINMLLTPIFTPPLDTEVGGQRPTVQLLEIRWEEGGYRFGFEKLGRWIDLCQKYGIDRFEICHLFTQWGTGCTPKIIVQTETGEEMRFGWQVKADSPEYQAFLDACLPALIGYLKEKGVYERTRFHISDEPNYEKHLEMYKTQRAMVAHLIPEEKLMEACSHVEFLEAGIIKKPVVITSSVEQFMEKGYGDIWAYYCCLPEVGNYGNRFIAMPSGSNRINGFQLYSYGIEGFLHWGYNFYYSALSRRLIDPFRNTDADEAFPSGDPFSVYPGKDGPLESLRSVVFYESLQDIRACKLLEGYIGREKVLKLIGPLKFNQYPATDEGVLAIRQRINEALQEVLP